MFEKTKANDVLRELEKQNPQVAVAFSKFRGQSQPVTLRSNVLERAVRRADIFEQHLFFERSIRLSDRAPRAILPALKPMSAWRVSPFIAGILLLFSGLLAAGVFLGLRAGRFLLAYWQSFLLPLAGLCIGAAVVILVSRFSGSPLSGVKPPDPSSSDPLQELKDLAERSASRLRSSYKLQLWTIGVVGAVFVALIAWSIIMVAQNRLAYASAFGSGSVAMLILTRWKWQPFDRINDARRLADKADTLATALRLRMKTISEIKNPTTRAKAQWEAVTEYLSYA